MTKQQKLKKSATLTAAKTLHKLTTSIYHRWFHNIWRHRRRWTTNSSSTATASVPGRLCKQSHYEQQHTQRGSWWICTSTSHHTVYGDYVDSRMCQRMLPEQRQPAKQSVNGIIELEVNHQPKTRTVRDPNRTSNDLLKISTTARIVAGARKLCVASWWWTSKISAGTHEMEPSCQAHTFMLIISVSLISACVGTCIEFFSGLCLSPMSLSNFYCITGRL